MELVVEDQKKSILKKLQKLSFLNKLWITLGKKTDALKWNSEGNGILINFIELEIKLKTKFQYFKENTPSDFYKALYLNGFEIFAKSENIKEDFDGEDATGIDPESGKIDFDRRTVGNTMSTTTFYEEFRRENFKENCYDLIFQSDLKKTDEDDILLPLMNEIDQENRKISESQQLKLQPINMDSCCKKIKLMSNLKKRRTMLETTLAFQKAFTLLNRRLRESNLQNKKDATIRLPADLYSNCYESISGFPEKPEYAGFYGNFILLDLIKSFFGEYIPVYVQNDLGVDSEPSFENCNKTLETSVNENSTTLESISTPTENSNESKYDDDDIVMDELIKFKNTENSNDSGIDTNLEESSSSTETFVTATVKNESEKEENFVNDNLTSSTTEKEFNSFLNEYRDSLNVLYQNNLD